LCLLPHRERWQEWKIYFKFFDEGCWRGDSADLGIMHMDHRLGASTQWK
jgi:hypothetical protein